MSKYKINNITFNLEEAWVCDEKGLCEREFGLGFTMLDIPSKHVIRMKADGYHKVVEINNREVTILSHTYEEDYIYGESVNSDLIESYNTDLHIVYFKWLSEQKGNYEIDVMCEHPYWLFHDMAHSDDVQGGEVCCLSSSREEYALERGLTLMKEHGYTPEFEEYYFEMIKQSFYNRWKTYGKIEKIFIPYVKELEIEDYE